MKLDEVIDIADKAYEMWMPHEHLIRKYYQNPRGNFGDSLAQFVVKELIDISRPGGNIPLPEAIDTINMAINDLGLIKNALIEKEKETK
ncbi:MAG: hypothetical protein WC390_10375 [Sulfurimonas sp.]|jgi:hypothetical protein